MNQIKTIVFDFDGVIINSNEIKEKAYFEVLPAHDHSLIKKIIGNQNVIQTRAAVFETFCVQKGFTGNDLRRVIDIHCANYNAFVQNEIEKLGVPETIIAALNTLSKNYNLYINSFTPQYSISETVERLKLGNFFKGVYGRISIESKKEEVLKQIMEKEKVIPAQVLFVGDAESDYKAAKNVECNFVGVSNDWNKWVKKEFVLVKSIGELTHFIGVLT